MDSFGGADDLDFGLEVNSSLLEGGRLDGFKEIDEIGGRGAAGVDEEISVDFRNQGATDLQTF